LKTIFVYLSCLLPTARPVFPAHQTQQAGSAMARRCAGALHAIAKTGLTFADPCTFGYPSSHNPNLPTPGPAISPPHVLAGFTADSLLAQSQLLNDRQIPIAVRPLKEFQQGCPFPDHFQQPASRRMVLQVRLEMLRKVVDSLRQEGDLDVRGTGVCLVLPMLFEDSGLRLDCHHGLSPLLGRAPALNRRAIAGGPRQPDSRRGV
jgi:hypothetical protein